MTDSIPPYNTAWRIHVTPSVPFAKYRENYGARSHHDFLDYDGLREGPYQIETGWCILRDDFMTWQRQVLTALSFLENETADLIYNYGRLLLDNQYKEKYLKIFPQTAEIVDQSVELSVSPKPDYVFRIWFYIVPTDVEVNLAEPRLTPISRTGLSVIEAGYLTDHEIPEANDTRPAGSRNKILSALRSPWVKQIEGEYYHRRFK